MTKNAKQIAKLIFETDTNYRGNLLMDVGRLLRLDGQGYTGKILQDVAHAYGINPKERTS